MGNYLKNILIIITILLVSACGAKVHNGGYGVRDAEKEKLATITTKEEIKEILGSPSSVTILGDQETWIYSAYRSEQTAFFNPDFTKYDIIIITFNTDGTVQNIKTKDLADKDFIQYAKKQTHFNGETQLGFWSELFGNIGRFSPATSQ